MNLKWPIVVVKIAKLILMHAKRLAMRAGNIVVCHFQLESFHVKDWISVIHANSSNASDPKSPLWIAVSKIGGFCVRIHKAKSYKKVCAFKSTVFFVDGAWVAPSMLLMNCVVLDRKDRASPGKYNKHLFRLRFEWLKTRDMRLPWEWCKSTCMTSYTTVFH